MSFWWRERPAPGGDPGANPWHEATELEAMRFKAMGFEVKVMEGDAMQQSKRERDLAAELSELKCENQRLRRQAETLQTRLIAVEQTLDLLKRENEVAATYLDKAKERRAAAPRNPRTKQTPKAKARPRRTRRAA